AERGCVKRRRVRVERHVDHRGRAARRGRGGPTRPALPVRAAGIVEVHVRVDRSGQHEELPRVDHLGGARVELGADRQDLPVADGHILFAAADKYRNLRHLRFLSRFFYRRMTWGLHAAGIPDVHERSKGESSMRRTPKLAALVGALIAALAVTAVSLGVTRAAPSNTSLPSISAAARDRSILTASNGGWANKPTSYSYQWLRCDSQGGGCNPISGAN